MGTGHPPLYPDVPEGMLLEQALMWLNQHTDKPLPHWLYHHLKGGTMSAMSNMDKMWCTRCRRNVGNCSAKRMKLSDQEMAMVDYAWKHNNIDRECLFWVKGTKSKTHVEEDV